MTYSIGDPAHIQVHNDLVADIAAEAVRIGAAPPVLPDTANLGDTGHVDDHNLIVAALAALQATPPPATGPSWAEVSGGTETTFVGDGTNGEAGKTYKVHTFTANGNLTVTKAGLADVLVVGGGAYADANQQAGGRVNEGMALLAAGSLAVAVGAGRTSFNGISLPSSLGTLMFAGGIGVGNGDYKSGAGADAATGANALKGRVSRITGAAVEYGKADNAQNIGGWAGKNGVVIVRVQV
jgi:hypothetical protein